MSLKIQNIDTTIIDIPTVRKHKLSGHSISKQSYVLVEVRLENGVIGYGEAATLGGASWSEESVESIKSVIDVYMQPLLLGFSADAFEQIDLLLENKIKRNYSAKAAISTAVLDAVGKTWKLPIYALLGGKVKNSFPVIWALASGDPQQELEEALQKIEEKRHREFKIKIGANDPAEDLKRLAFIQKGLEGKGKLKVVDANQAWTRDITKKYLPAFAEIGIELLEQPLPHWDLEGLALFKGKYSTAIMADESVFTPYDLQAVIRREAAEGISLKLVKQGSLFTMKRVAYQARTAGLANYGGCLLESSWGAAAHLHVFATLPPLAWGTETFGPLILENNFSTENLVYENFEVKLPESAGLGLEIDKEKVKFYGRK